ncbi:hypothetical protein SAMN04488062_11711 [Flavobacterium omnivorum]|uniref:Uncharacterized protein n=1 Tax=Flavobacterium omnivorum TaxID=178355 RepID=A0A1G8G3D4_9FLAO|nr:hypothetical protein [Flavobacterium omnivorum]SDH88953.1 hypothetical protein SAMN04488062_11711 [Flavobacterium omnivorum]
MNINQKQGVLDTLEALNNIDIDQLLLNAYPTETDFSKISFNKYVATEFLFLLNKMISQLENEIENGLGFLLPFSENFANDFGAVNLHPDLISIQNYLNASDFNSVEPLLDKLIHYQIKNGFWNKSEVKSHPVDLEEIKKQKTLIRLNQKALNKNLSTYISLETDLKTLISDFDILIKAKKIELNQITNLLTIANLEQTEISKIVSNIKNKDTEIDGIVRNVKDKVITVSESIIEYDADYTVIKKDNLTLKLQLENVIAKTLEDLKKSKEGIEFVESNREEIIRLTGMAADGTLGSKFDQRQVKLEKDLTFWKWAVPIISLITLIWIVVVFTCLSPHFENQWLNILINIIKTSPAFVLLGFVFSQYKKERNLQEEYAFKSAVAMTLTAYSEMLSNADNENNNSRQLMLLKSIELVYNQPKIHPDKNQTLFSFNTKDLKETVSSLSDTLKNIKNN